MLLAATALGVLFGEWLYRTRISGIGLNPAWLLVELAIAAVGLALVWRVQEGLRAGPLIAVAAAFHLAWLALHAHYDIVDGDGDSRELYPTWGRAVLDGGFPDIGYPPGALVLFAVEELIRSDLVRNPNGLLMVPFQVAAVAAVWSLRTRFSAWLAAVVAVWPANAFFWEFRFDLIPAALVVVGVALALRERWARAGLLLGIGTVVKWVPSLSFAALAVSLLATRRMRPLARLSIVFGGVLVAVALPLVVTQGRASIDAYTRQAAYGINIESVYYLPLRAAGVVGGGFSTPEQPARAPEWANTAAGVGQLLLAVAVVCATAFVRRRPVAVAALAVLAPTVFLLLNRLFSPQYLVEALVAWAFAAALVVRSRGDQLAVAAVAAVATVANMFVYPFVLWDWNDTWLPLSAVMFASALALTAWLGARALRLEPWQPQVADRPYGASVVVTRGDDVLILHRAAHPDSDGDWAWTNPTGARQPGETIEECARRELREETGLELDLEPVDLSGEWAIFRAEAPPDTDVVLDAEHDRYEWVPLDEAYRRCLPDVVAAGIRRGARRP